ncbi:MAG: hypothetical protein LBK06_06590 [Planctomycetaceae bacterium]|nr:hypothetical protein [Planctomycetaceae bacterium]
MLNDNNYCPCRLRYILKLVRTLNFGNGCLLTYRQAGFCTFVLPKFIARTVYFTIDRNPVKYGMNIERTQ